ncbi:YqiA/YcfP family alpha/beta fold hydrolase [Gramella sp. KN1008]|uniref:YqiA/YcfP family alpha/beta fold hydrolase n=1 Tax=Gramella sp. KN1008 TaxID=2529298 RepID=UPI00103B981D|nr:YqiA/YcfP family alpha/beta fold hydrolase [Gramella sp. KN1008]TBW30254.1 hypothetical protein EZJ28_02310 [Gramella sp. KN1008]
MNILYLHGLNSKLSPEKRKVLEKYGEVYAPDIDYQSEHIQPVEILKQYPDTHFNVIIGSSMGGLNAFIISENIGRPALLFNPPLVNHMPLKFQNIYTKGLAQKAIILGRQDKIVNPSDTLKFLGRYSKEAEVLIKLFPHLEHRIPLELFKDEVKEFFSKLCY